MIIHKSKSIALLRPVKMSENNSTLMLNFFKWWVAPHSFAHSSRKERCVEPHSSGHWTRSLMGSKILFAIFDGLYLIAASLLLCLVLHTKCYSFDALNPHWNFSIEALFLEKFKQKPFEWALKHYPTTRTRQCSYNCSFLWKLEFRDKMTASVPKWLRILAQKTARESEL